MDIEKKPYANELRKIGTIVEKYSGDIGITSLIPAPTTVTNEGFKAICAMKVDGIVLHRDLIDTQETKQGGLGQPAEHITTDKEEYVFIPIAGIRAFKTVVIEASISDKK